MWLQLAGTHAHVSIHVLDTFNLALGEHRPNRNLGAPNALPRVIDLWFIDQVYIMPALPH